MIATENIFNNTSSIMQLDGVQLFPFSMILAGAEIGDGVRIQSFSIVEGGAKIGVRTTVHAHNIICGSVEIGENCFISSFVGFIDRTYPQNRSKDPIEKTIIGNNVVIGVSAVLFPISVGDYAIIGANSTVLRDVEGGEIVSGVVK